MAVLESVTFDLAVTALDMYLLRHQVIANNIANHDSAGFRAQQLDFESHLSALKSAVTDRAPADDIRAALARVEAETSVRPKSDPKVRLDNEMVELVKNTVQYQAVLSALGRLGALNRTAISGAIQ